MEPKLNERFDQKGKTYITEEGGCGECAFLNRRVCDKMICNSGSREDGLNVHFKKVDPQDTASCC